MYMCVCMFYMFPISTTCIEHTFATIAMAISKTYFDAGLVCNYTSTLIVRWRLLRFAGGSTTSAFNALRNSSHFCLLITMFSPFLRLRVFRMIGRLKVYDSLATLQVTSRISNSCLLYTSPSPRDS